MSDPHIDVVLTDAKELHCFKLIFHVKINDKGDERAPMEFFLHTTQAFDLFHKLGQTLLEYFAQTSGELLTKVRSNHEARELLRETSNLLHAAMVSSVPETIPDAAYDLVEQANKITSFLNGRG